MPSKRAIVKLLSRDELQAIVEQYELSVTDRRVRDQLVDAVASSKKATRAELQPAFSRDRLKELCRAVHLDDSGREKATLVERLSLEQLRSVKSALMSVLLTGEVRVTPNEDAA